MKTLAPLIAVALAGCSQGAGVVASAISLPDAKYMLPIPPVIQTPAGIETNDKGKAHIANLRNQCGDFRETASGLQQWAGIVTKKDDKK